MLNWYDKIASGIAAADEAAQAAAAEQTAAEKLQQDIDLTQAVAADDSVTTEEKVAILENEGVEPEIIEALIDAETTDAVAAYYGVDPYWLADKKAAWYNMIPGGADTAIGAGLGGLAGAGLGYLAGDGMGAALGGLAGAGLGGLGGYYLPGLLRGQTPAQVPVMTPEMAAEAAGMTPEQIIQLYPDAQSRMPETYDFFGGTPQQSVLPDKTSAWYNMIPGGANTAIGAGLGGLAGAGLGYLAGDGMGAALGGLAGAGLGGLGGYYLPGLLRGQTPAQVPVMTPEMAAEAAGMTPEQIVQLYPDAQSRMPETYDFFGGTPQQSVLPDKSGSYDIRFSRWFANKAAELSNNN